jgi:hypothetical protein
MAHANDGEVTDMSQRTSSDQSEWARARRVPPVLGIVLWAAWCAGTAASDWEPFGLQGLRVRTLAVASELICAGTDAAGVHCRELSTDGAAWVPRGLDGETITELWIDDTNPQVMFAALALSTSPGLYRTLDGGENWERLVEGLAESARAVHGVPGSPTVFACRGKFYRSLDHGESWEELLPGSWAVSFTQIEVAPTDETTVWLTGYTGLGGGLLGISRNSGVTWATVWGSDFESLQTIAAHRAIDGLVLTGRDGFVMRTENHGETFETVLDSGTWLVWTDWDGGNPERGYAVGLESETSSLAFVSRDLGRNWSPHGAPPLSTRVSDVAGDHHRLGVVYVATDDGVFRLYGGGLKLCVDSRDGLDRIRLGAGACFGIPPAVTPQDVIVGHLSALKFDGSDVDLGDVECMANDVGFALFALDPPEPAPGDGLFILVREEGELGYGVGDPLPERTAARGDCPR